jgi:5-methylcytosine-specific restriction endonuclease McrA
MERSKLDKLIAKDRAYRVAHPELAEWKPKKRSRTIRKRKKQRFSSEYRAYIKSPEWKVFRLTIFAARGKVCERCRNAKGPHEVHHLTYVRLGREIPADVQVLCNACHKIAHAK